MSLKKIMKKSIAAFIAIILLYSNCYLCGLGISSAIAQNVKEPSINISLENTKYVQFNEQVQKEGVTESVENQEELVEYNSGVAIKSKIQIGLEEQETKLPIKKSELYINLPALNGYLPIRANVVLADTSMSTGEKNNNKINQIYNSNSGLLSLSYENKEANSNYNQETKDQFEIIYIYQPEAYTGNQEEILKYTVNSKMTFESENVQVVSEKTQESELIEKNNKGDILEFSVTELENNIYKGFMYSNVEYGTKYNTDFNTVATLSVLNRETAKDLVMHLEENKFLLNDEENTEISAEEKIIYKSTKINKSEFDNILGENGVLEVFNKDILLATVKYVPVNENEKIVNRLAVIYSNENMQILPSEETFVKIEYHDDITSLIIKTTKPIREGYINFKNANTIKPSQEYVVDVDKIKSIKTTSTVNEVAINVELLLLEPETKISVNSSNVNFSTLQNSKTTLTINLDSTNASTKLFNNPTITIKLPDGLVGGNLSSPEIVNGNGLKIKNAITNNNVITVELEGKQTVYDLTNVSGGASIVMDIENIDFADTIPSHTDSIEVSCVQGKEKVTAKQNINIVSKEGLLMLSSIKGHNYEEVVTNIDSNIKEIEISDNADKKQVTQTVSLVNNYGIDLENFEIVGRIGYSDNEFASTFDTKLTKEITINKEGAQIYYSTDKNAKYNDNSWSKEFNANAKSYKIVLNNNKLLKLETVTINIYAEIPEKVGYNQITALQTKVNYNVEGKTITEATTTKMKTAIVKENNKEVIDTIQTYQSVDNLNVEIGSSMKVAGKSVEEGSEIGEGQIVKYSVVLKNNENYKVENININTVIENAVYYEIGVIGESGLGLATGYIEAKDGDVVRNKTISLEPNSSQIFEYQVIVKENVENIKNFIKISINNNSIYEKQYNNPVKQAELKLKLESEYNEEYLIYTGSRVEFKIDVTNISDKTLKNVRISCNLPKELIYDINKLDEYFWYEEPRNFDKIEKENNTLYWTINSIEAGKTKTICVRPEVPSLGTSIVRKDFVLVANANCNKKDYISNDLIKTVYQKETNLNATINVNKESNSKLNNGDEIILNINLKNDGSLNLQNVSANINASYGIEIQSYKDVKTNKEVKLGNNIREYSIQNITLNSGESREYIVYAKVNTNNLEENQITLNANIIDGLGKSINFDTLIYNVELESDDDFVENDNINSDVNMDGDDAPIIDEFIPEVDDSFDVGNPPNMGDTETPDNPTGGETPDNPSGGETPGNPSGGETPDNPSGGETPGNPSGGETPDNPSGGETPDKPSDDQENNDKPDNNEMETPGNRDEDYDSPDDGDNEDESTGDHDDRPADDNGSNQGNNNEGKQNYKISGIVWIDLNKNGKREEKETLQQNVKVSLIDKNTGNYLEDQNGRIVTTITNEYGRYEFAKIPKGSYMVMFEFDTNNYTVTTYKKEGIKDNINSDAISSQVSINGENKLVGLTDNIELVSNAENIDIGLIQNAMFDLSLDKKITKITVIDKQGTKEYEYKDGHTAKVDLVAKYINGANVIINYKFVITNEGEITGYVNNLVDSIPSGLEFSSEFNNQWYKGTDGKLYTNSLSSKPIKPGESIEVELVLTKTMNEDNLGTFVNSAELEKISNLENINEKEEKIENNQSSAILIISIKTGSVILYIGITILCLAIISAGAYFINKKILRQEI